MSQMNQTTIPRTLKGQMVGFSLYPRAKRWVFRVYLHSNTDGIYLYTIRWMCADTATKLQAS